MSTVRVSRIISLAIIAMLLLTSTAFAAGDPLVQRVEMTNCIIETKIDNAIGQAGLAYNTCMYRINAELNKLDTRKISMRTAQRNISLIIAAYDAQIDSIAARLITNTDRMAFNLQLFGLKYNVEIINEYVEVQLGGRTYLVDPLRIVGH